MTDRGRTHPAPAPSCVKTRPNSLETIASVFREPAFEVRGRDMRAERFIWQAPNGDDGARVCTGCPFAATCPFSGGKRRHLRVHRADFPQIDWGHPQHQSLHKKTYSQRTGAESGIKRIKKDFGGELSRWPPAQMLGTATPCRRSLRWFGHRSRQVGRRST